MLFYTSKVDGNSSDILSERPEMNSVSIPISPFLAIGAAWILRISILACSLGRGISERQNFPYQHINLTNIDKEENLAYQWHRVAMMKFNPGT